MAQFLKPWKCIPQRRSVELAPADQLPGKLPVHKGVRPLPSAWPNISPEQRGDSCLKRRVVAAVRAVVIAAVYPLTVRTS
jgi:hypothetical protein